MGGFREDLKALGWTKAQLGMRLGVARETVSRWGEEPPKFAVEYVRVCRELERMNGVLFRLRGEV